MADKKRVDDMIKVRHIKSPLLRLIFQGQAIEAEAKLRQWSWDKYWEKDFQFDLLTAFWLAVHTEQLEFTKKCMQYDIYFY